MVKISFKSYHIINHICILFLLFCGYIFMNIFGMFFYTCVYNIYFIWKQNHDTNFLYNITKKTELCVPADNLTVKFRSSKNKKKKKHPQACKLIQTLELKKKTPDFFFKLKSWPCPLIRLDGQINKLIIRTTLKYELFSYEQYFIKKKEEEEKKPYIFFKVKLCYFPLFFIHV